MALYDVSESVAKGHPDKVADQISDALLDAYVQQDPYSRVAIEALVSHRLIAVGGEVTSDAHVNIEEIVRKIVADCGYGTEDFGDLSSNVDIISSIVKQSPDIAHGVGDREKLFSTVAAGDQGMMFGYATNETGTYMPKSYEMARMIVSSIENIRAREKKSLFGPDGKTEVSLHENEAQIVVSWQHKEDAPLTEIRQQLLDVVEKTAVSFDVKIDRVLLNPSGRFVCGGPFADTGLTGRKQIVDSYGGSVHHGGGSYSGKDCTKVDRSGAYMARYVAKHIVAAGFASRCETQLVFSIAVEKPISFAIDCFGTATVDEEILKEAVLQTFPWTVSAIIKELSLTQALFLQTAAGGHFGREEFFWEKLPRLKELQSKVKELKAIRG